MAIETPYSKLSALVVDDAPVQQSVLRGQLTMLGIQRVDVAGNPDDALRLLRAKRHDLVLCDYRLGHKTDGQQLFEFLRENEVLSVDSLFFMVTAENNYASVAAASEHKPDAYLLKPITAADVEDRLRAGIERRKAMSPVTAPLARGDLAGALAACDTLLARKDRWQVALQQHKGQILLRLARPVDAGALYLEVLEQNPKLVWAQVGQARALKAAGRLEEAKQAAQALLASRDGERNLAAYDLLAETLEAQGDTRGAQWALRDAALAVPSARRHRLLADCAYRNGDLSTARESLDQVAKATQGAITAQPQDQLLLAQTLVDQGEAPAALAVLDGSAKGRQALPPAMEGVVQALRAQALMRSGDSAGAAVALARARETQRSAKADFATVALARAELLAGDAEAGMALLATAIGADHENPRVKQLVCGALRSTGHEDRMEGLVAQAMAAVEKQVGGAKTLFRDSRIDEALSAIDALLKAHPDNTGVLLQAAQMNCMALRLKKQANAAAVERVRLHLTRLQQLMPGNDRVAQMQRYFRETLAGLASVAVQPERAAA